MSFSGVGGKRSRIHYSLCAMPAFAGLLRRVILSLSAQELERWIVQIEKTVSSLLPTDASGVKNILLPTPKAGVHLFLSPAEIICLQTLVEEADSEAKVRELLQLFQ